MPRKKYQAKRGGGRNQRNKSRKKDVNYPKIRDILKLNVSSSDIVSSADLGHLAVLICIVATLMFLSLYTKGYVCPATVYFVSAPKEWYFSSWFALPMEPSPSPSPLYADEPGGLYEVDGLFQPTSKPASNPSGSLGGGGGGGGGGGASASVLGGDYDKLRMATMLSNLNLNVPLELLDHELSELNGFPIWTQPTEIDLSQFTAEQQELLLNNQFCRVQGSPTPFEQRLGFDNEGFIEFQGCHVLPTQDNAS